jgi:formylglycine-generating enzyme required for sulfatase activity
VTRRPTKTVLAIAFATSLGACDSFDHPMLPPTGQILLYVDTDAIVPLAPTEPAEETTPAPIFDRLRIEMIEPGADGPCNDCTREFPVDRRLFKSARASVGLVPRVGVAGYRARLTLYRTFRSEIAGPRPASSLVSVITLPSIAAEGIVSVHTVLRTEDLATSRGTLEAPIPFTAGAPPASLVDTWARAQRVSCAEAPGDGEVCVPGGAYWQGDLTATQPTEQLVAISPFYLDATEVTVKRMRSSSVAASGVANGDVKLQLPGGNAKLCTYTEAPGANEERPVNCVRKAFAQKFCEAAGGRLPTEAEYQFVASGRVGSAFVWGDDLPACADAIFGRNEDMSLQAARSCVAAGVGAANVATGARDVLVLRTGRVFDLNGNVAEWAFDDYVGPTDPCRAALISIDPVCTATPKIPTFRGGAWNVAGGDLRAVNRGKLDAVGADLGFRCARGK